MKKKYEITSCGLSCDLCDANTTKIQDSSIYLLKVFKDPMFSSVISMINPDFRKYNLPDFKKMLEIISQNPPCPGCNERKDCVINQCTSDKKIKNCGQCNSFDIVNGKCNAIPQPLKTSMMPPAPIFLDGLTKRYQKWNVKNLIAFAEGREEETSAEIEKMVQNGKSNRDIIDLAVNLFEMKP